MNIELVTFLTVFSSIIIYLYLYRVDFHSDDSPPVPHRVPVNRRSCVPTYSTPISEGVGWREARREVCPSELEVHLLKRSPSAAFLNRLSRCVPSPSFSFFYRNRRAGPRQTAVLGNLCWWLTLLTSMDS